MTQSTKTGPMASLTTTATQRPMLVQAVMGSEDIERYLADGFKSMATIRYTRRLTESRLILHHLFNDKDGNTITVHLIKGLLDEGFSSRVEIRPGKGRILGSFTSPRPDHPNADVGLTDLELELFGRDMLAVSAGRLIALLTSRINICPRFAQALGSQLLAALEYEMGKL